MSCKMGCKGAAGFGALPPTPRTGGCSAAFGIRSMNIVTDPEYAQFGGMMKRYKFGKKKTSMAMKKRNCAAKGKKYNKLKKRCVAKKSGGRKVTMKQKMARCKAKGLVYDRKTKRCRKPKKGRKAGFGETTLVAFGKKKTSMAMKKRKCAAKGKKYNKLKKRCVAKKAGGRKVTMKQKMARCKAKGLVYDRKTKRCRKPKNKKGRKKASFGDMILGAFGAKKTSLAVKKRRCAAKGKRYNQLKKRCVSKKSYGRKMTMKQKINRCKAKGLVYDLKTKRCRKPRNKKAYFGSKRKGKGRRAYMGKKYRKAGFGMMHSSPSDFRTGVSYLNDVKFESPNMLLDSSFTQQQVEAARQQADMAAVSNAMNV